MDFATLVAKVIIETNRADLGFISDGGSGEIPSSVAAALMELHTMDNFTKDIKEAQVQFTTPAYIQDLDTSTIPNFRNVAFIRKWDPAWAAAEANPTVYPTNAVYSRQSALNNFTIRDLGDIFDIYGYEMTDIAYQAGYNLKMKSSTLVSYCILSYYAFPDLDLANDGKGMVSWIANEYPYAVIYKATSNTYTSEGQQENSRKYDAPLQAGGLVASHIKNLLQNNITAQGR